jgi:hypothetical protein
MQYEAYSPFQYPWFCLNYFIAVYVFSRFVYSWFLHGKNIGGDLHTTFQSLTEEKRRNAIIYVLQILMTSTAFVLQIYGGADTLFRWKETTTTNRMEWAVFALQTIAVLYIWELIYRQKIGVPLLLHHVITLVLIQLSYVSLFDTGDIIYNRMAILLGFYATTEQLSFVALFCYRMNLLTRWHSALFLASAAQTFLIKTAITVVASVYFSTLLAGSGFDDQPTSWSWFWKVCFIPLLLALFAAQLYACKILWELHNKCLPPNETPTSDVLARLFRVGKHTSKASNKHCRSVEVTDRMDSCTDDESNDRAQEAMELGRTKGTSTEQA